MKILLVDPWGLAGITTCYAHLAKYLISQGHTCDAYCFMEKWPDGYMLEPYCHNMISAPTSLTELLVRGDYDMVHLTACCFSYPLSAAVHLKRARFHGGVVVMSQQPIEYEIPENVADALVGVSASSAEALRKKNKQEVHLISNGVATDIFYPKAMPEKPERPILAWIGRATDLSQKDVHGFLYLVSALRDQNYDFWLVDGDQEIGEHIKRLPKWFGTRIKYTRKMPYSQVADFYRTVAASGGAVISTSGWEAMAFAILEAWACGCPTIVPRAKGFEHCEKYKASLIYDQEDALSQILELVSQLHNSARREELIQKGYEAIAQEFSGEHMAESYLKLYETVLQERQGKTSRNNSDLLSRNVWNLHAKLRRYMPHRYVPTLRRSTR